LHWSRGGTRGIGRGIAANPSNIDAKELTLDEARRIRDARFPIGRPPTAEDVADAVAFFASEEAEYMTGQVVNVSGGWML
jgi:NAD(P)-dependent dehydrogenase (short-subunit alcohol dehydrogenase family)